MRAHDVRSLTRCKGCNRLGLDFEMVAAEGGHWHGRCVFERLGDGVLRLPLAQRNKLTISDVGVAMMRRLLDAR